MKSKILLFCFALSSIFSFGTHLMGGDITWKCIKSGSNSGYYVFEVKVYRDCQGVPITLNSALVCHNISSLDSIPLYWVSGTDISPVCDTVDGVNDPFSCNGLNLGSSTTDPGAVEEHIYRSDTIRILGTPDANGWHFTWSSCCRNNAITNISNPGNYGFTLRAVMYPYIDSTGNILPNSGYCFDSSPKFYEKPRTILEVGNGYDPLAFSNGFTYSHNAFDEEQDSLSYQWANPLDHTLYDFLNPAASAVPFLAPFTSSSPINGIYLNNITGRTYYPANQQGNYVTCTNVSAYRCGQKIAEIFREIQIILVPPICNLGDTTNGNYGADTLCNTRPVVQPPFFYPASSSQYQWDTIVHCGDTVSFDFIANDYDYYPNGARQDLLFEVSGGQFYDYNNNQPCQNPPCATFQQIGTGSTPPFVTSGGAGGGYFEWITSCNHLANNCASQGPVTYTFVIKVQDDFCPAPAIENTSQVISITVYPPCGNIKANEIVSDETACGVADGSITCNPSGGVSPYNIYLFDMSGIPVNANNLSSGNYQIRITDATLCEMIDTLYVGGPASNTYTNNITVCNGDSVVVGTNVYNTTGIYTDVFSDIFGCDSIIVTDLVISSSINANSISNPALCNGYSDASIDITVSGGVMPYSYTWSNGSTSEDLFNIPAGLYSVLVSDSIGCNYYDTIGVSQPAPLSSSINNSSGIITGVTSGGTSPYSYTFSGPTGLILSVSNNNGTPVSINVLSSGNYSLVVTDFNGCTDSVGIFVSNNDFSPSFNVILSNNLCDSITDLTIIVSQDSGEVDMSTGLITSNAGYFDIAAYNIGDTIGTATLMAAGGSVNLNTMIMISNIISANSAVVVACDSVQGCIGGFTINNTVGGGINILTNTVPDGNNYTGGNMSSITFESIFVNPCIPLTFYYTINSELGDVFTDSITFTITSTQNYSIEDDVLIYPNPNDGKFIIQTNKEYKEIRVLVTDILGKNIYFDNVYSNLLSQEVNLDVDNGLYLISLQNGNRVIYSRNIVIYR